MTTQMNERGPKERLYDEQVSPLMVQIIKLCRVAGIPFYASFGLDGDLACTSYAVPALEEVPADDREHVRRFREVHDRAQRGIGAESEFAAFTITSAPTPAAPVAP